MKNIWLFLLIASLSNNFLEAERIEIPCLFIYDASESLEALIIEGHMYDIYVIKHSNECGCSGM